jgi:hypothetical protein
VRGDTVPNGIIPNEGLPAVLKRLLDPAGSGSATWRAVLWVNDLVPDEDTVLADLTQATFGGYAFATLTPGTWTAATVVAGCATSTWGTVPITWTVSLAAGQTVYGWAMRDATVPQLRFVQRFDDGDIFPLEDAMKVKLLPTFTLTSAACGSMLTARMRRLPKRER